MQKYLELIKKRKIVMIKYIINKINKFIAKIDDFIADESINFYYDQLYNDNNMY